MLESLPQIRTRLCQRTRRADARLRWSLSPTFIRRISRVFIWDPSISLVFFILIIVIVVVRRPALSMPHGMPMNGNELVTRCAPGVRPRPVKRLAAVMNTGFVSPPEQVRRSAALSFQSVCPSERSMDADHIQAPNGARPMLHPHRPIPSNPQPLRPCFEFSSEFAAFAQSLAIARPRI